MDLENIVDSFGICVFRDVLCTHRGKLPAVFPASRDTEISCSLRDTKVNAVSVLHKNFFQRKYFFRYLNDIDDIWKKLYIYIYIYIYIYVCFLTGFYRNPYWARNL